MRSTANDNWPGGRGIIHNGGFGSRFSFSLTLEGRRKSTRHRGIFAAAKTGYVVLCIEPAGHSQQSPPAPLRYGASSAFPSLTRATPFAAWLDATSGCRKARKRLPGQHHCQKARAVPIRLLVDRSGTTQPTVTLEGLSMTLEGPGHPAQYRHLRGQALFWSWPATTAASNLRNPGFYPQQLWISLWETRFSIDT